MNMEQKERIEYIIEVNEVNEEFKVTTQERIKELLALRHKLAKEILILRDKIAQKRYTERKVLLKAKQNETTLY